MVAHSVVENPGQLGSDRRHGLERRDHFNELRIHDGENAASNELNETRKNGKEASREASVVSTISRRRGFSEVEGRSRRERQGREKSWRNI